MNRPPAAGPERALRRVLYLEDDASIAELAMMALQDVAGLEALHCASGAEACARAVGFKPDVLLLDVMLPDMDGPQTLAALRALPNMDKTPAIFMTAKAQVHQQAAYRAMGAAGVIVKPFDPLTLGDEIADIWRAAVGAPGAA